MVGKGECIVYTRSMINYINENYKIEFLDKLKGSASIVHMLSKNQNNQLGYLVIFFYAQ